MPAAPSKAKQPSRAGRARPRPGAPATSHGSEPRVYLVGAGPGDPELITLKGKRVLERADAVLYDELANPELLNLVPENCERCYVGKRARHHALAQADIQDWIITRARRGCTVVRLKGGDPLIFGRGGEELAALSRAGIAWEVIPGISAGHGVASAAGIPLTHRGVASGVRFVAGHAGLDAHPAPGSETLVLFMAAGRVSESADALLAQGWPPATPVAILERGTLPGERRIFARLDRIGARARRAAVQTPALLIIGRVAGLPNQWRRLGRSVSPTRKNDTAAPAGLILMAHGSPLAEWQRGVHQLARELAAPGQFSQAAFLPPVEPSLAQAVDAAIERRVRELIVVPYFLAPGLHVTRDIPALVEAERRRHPRLRIALADCLQGHPALRTAVLDLHGRSARVSFPAS